MQNRLIAAVENSQIRKDLPHFRVGDNVKVHFRIKEGTKERIQIFEGLVIAMKHEGTKETFVVRKISYGVGVERTFPINSPLISTIELVRSNKVRRAKLYYMRERKGKAARMKEIRR
ncbi:50S ribosomal protein L19 [Candidatus Mycoplasma pogonae]